MTNILNKLSSETKDLLLLWCEDEMYKTWTVEKIIKTWWHTENNPPLPTEDWAVIEEYINLEEVNND